MLIAELRTVVEQSTIKCQTNTHSPYIADPWCCHPTPRKVLNPRIYFCRRTIGFSKNEIFFRPHMLNIGDLSNKYLKINEIISFEKPAFPLFLKIHTKDNRIMFLSTWSRNKIIESIRRRQA